MSLCVLAGGKLVTLAVTAFTLSWTHSVEKTAWSETWRVTADGLAIESARVQGTGAGMEPAPDAVFDGSGWVYRPKLAPQERLMLANSAEGGTWRLCADSRCLDFGGNGGEPIVLEACD